MVTTKWLSLKTCLQENTCPSLQYKHQKLSSFKLWLSLIIDRWDIPNRRTKKYYRIIHSWLSSSFSNFPKSILYSFEYTVSLSLYPFLLSLSHPYIPLALFRSLCVCLSLHSSSLDLFGLLKKNMLQSLIVNFVCKVKIKWWLEDGHGQLKQQ